MDLTEDFKNFSDTEIREKIVKFLENLINDFKNKKTNHDQDMKITEFYINQNYENLDGDEKKYINYFTLGWYIYENLLDKK